jgi:hypothetical protein
MQLHPGAAAALGDLRHAGKLGCRSYWTVLANAEKCSATAAGGMRVEEPSSHMHVVPLHVLWSLDGWMIPWHGLPLVLQGQPSP